MRSRHPVIREQTQRPHGRRRMVMDLVERLGDDERRAALLLAFHSIQKRATTHCCQVNVCFNCKRMWNSDHNNDPNAPCDRDELAQDDIVQCRACRVMIVKVEGCSTVYCPCRCSMHWDSELWIRDHEARQLLPVDADDIEGFRRWDQWRQAINSIVLWEMEPRRVAFRKGCIGELLAPHRSLPRRLLQARIWWKRFKPALPELEVELSETRREFLQRQLQRSEPFRRAVRAKLQGLRWKLCMRSLRRVPCYNEEDVTQEEAGICFGLFGGY